MKNAPTYKTKFYIFLLSSLVFLILCYNLAFKRTVTEIKTLKENSRQYANLQNAHLQLNQLDLKYKNLSVGLLVENDIVSNGEVLLLGKANSLIKGLNLKITELPHNDTFVKNGVIVKTQTIIVQGSFTQLLTFLHSLEQDKSLGNICSVDYYSQKGLSSGTILLKMKVYFQTIIQDKKQ